MSNKSFLIERVRKDAEVSIRRGLATIEIKTPEDMPEIINIPSMRAYASLRPSGNGTKIYDLRKY